MFPPVFAYIMLPFPQVISQLFPIIAIGDRKTPGRPLSMSAHEKKAKRPFTVFEFRPRPLKTRMEERSSTSRTLLDTKQ